VAFVELGDKPVLATVSTGGGAATEIWRDDGQGWVFPNLRGGIAWSADGKFILFIRQKGDRGQLWAVPAEGGQARRTELTFTGQAGGLSVHPDGKRITYTMSHSGNEYWVMNNFLPPAK
jgi:Tol biopolymer transport system component